jgi:hypothetical protein
MSRISYSGRAVWNVLAVIAVGSTLLSLARTPRLHGSVGVPCTNDTQCDDLNNCTADDCFKTVNPFVGTCRHTALSNLTCDDGAACTSGDVCVFGTCIGIVNNSFCTDGFDCTSDVCNPANATDPSGCVHTPRDADCQDGFSCSVEACNPLHPDADATGCTQFLNDTFCDDSINCTVDACNPNLSPWGDGCVNDPMDSFCDDSNPCTDNFCNATADCQFPANNSLSCDDGLFCNGMEFCMNATCVVPGDPCLKGIGDPDDDCTESCNEATDDCTAPDPNGSACQSTACSGTPVNLTCLDGECNDDGDGVPASEEQAQGDTCFNGDSSEEADWKESYATTVQQSPPQTLSTPPDCTNFIVTRADIKSEAELPMDDPDFFYPEDLLAFETRCITTTPLPVKIFYHDGIQSLDGAVVRKFNLNTGQYETLSAGAPHFAMTGTNAVPFVMYTLPDCVGAPCAPGQDADPDIREFKDPVGPAYPEPVPTPALTPWAVAAALLLLAAVAFLALRRRGGFTGAR